MKYFLSICFLIVITSSSFSQQQLVVKSFNKLPNDLDARVNEAKKDQNGDLCAIIKVVTTQTGFTFDCGQIGIIKTVQKPSEIWVYVPYGAKRITISHPYLGILRDYQLPLNIEKATVYELVLISGNVITTIEETIVSQWLVITTEPADAMIYINEKYVKNGSYQAKFKPGNYSYRVEAPKYHTEAGKFEISDVKKELTVILKPAFGYATITSEPELGAKVIVDGESLNNTTPYEKLQLNSGEHIIQVIKDNYQPASQKVTITDGRTSLVKFTLNPNFTEVGIFTLKDAQIYIDNENKGKGNWQGRLSLGVHSLEARLEKYKTARKDIEIVAGGNQRIDLSPTPIFGYADIVTIPPGAIIGIDGKNYGTSPNTIKDLSVGEHQLRLIKQGFSNVDTIIVVTEGKITEISVNLKVSSITNAGAPKTKQALGKILQNLNNSNNSKEVKPLADEKNTIEKKPDIPVLPKISIKTLENAGIYIDSEFKEKGFWEGPLDSGFHSLEARLDNYKTAKKNIFVVSGRNQKIDLIPQLKLGTAKVVTNPMGATVGIDGTNYGLSPRTVKDLSIGQHSLRIIKQGYENIDTLIMIFEGALTDLKLKMNKSIPKNNPQANIKPEAEKNPNKLANNDQPVYVKPTDEKSTSEKSRINSDQSEVTIKTHENAEIFIDNTLVGKGIWKGNLQNGIYSLEARLDKFRSSKRKIEIIGGGSQNINLILTSPLGTADVISIPPGAIIGIDGINYGQTPKTIKDLSAGEHNLRLISKGYANVDTTFAILEGVKTKLFFKLTGGLSTDSLMVKSRLKNEMDKRGLEKDQIIKDQANISTKSPPENTVKDIDGNVYQTVTIGNQIWMSENLKTTKFKDGTAIRLVSDNIEWGSLTKPAYCWYKNDTTYKKNYGALYNWYVIKSEKICPNGWHVPTDAEWFNLPTVLGGSAGGKLKETGTEHWNNPNRGATNETGFNALPGGYRHDEGVYYNMVFDGFWWSSTETSNDYAWGRGLSHIDPYLYNGNYFKRNGFSVRCLKDMKGQDATAGH
ncbi:MAG: PEGA domain-containing protein [Prolixibacteraceae bacterium]